MKNILKKLFITFTPLLLLTSCESIIKLSESEQNNNFQVSKPHFSFVFSHSIMGETHPCGCRHFPLGGLPQVAGLFNELKKDKELFYVDTGDSLFPSSNIPPFILESMSYAAMNLAKGLDQVGLKYMVPGDYDLALGWDFLKEVLGQVKFQLLISNLKDEKTIAHKKYVKIEFGKKTIYLLGLVDPASFATSYANDFQEIDQAMPELMTLLKKEKYDEKNKDHMLIVLSHSGIDKDQVLAGKYPQINWIIGAHTQSFTNNPVEVGQTNIVQVLSKNHYIGEVQIPSENTEIKEPFKYHEIRDELKDKLTPNPFIDFIAKHKSDLDKIRDGEQAKFSQRPSNFKLKTQASCLECHQDQAAHWQDTPHSIAFGSLIKANEANNTTCIECHSVGLGKEGGFLNFKDIVTLKDESKTEEYWAEVNKAFSNVESIRKLPAKSIRKIRSELDAIDKKFEVSSNFTNVQCLNCHNRHPDHPFAVGEDEGLTAEVKRENIAKNCLQCHTKEQSPEWYEKDEKGLGQNADQKIIKELFKKVGCTQK